MYQDLSTHQDWPVKKPLSICQSRWREIRNTPLVICSINWGPTTEQGYQRCFTDDTECTNQIKLHVQCSLGAKKVRVTVCLSDKPVWLQFFCNLNPQPDSKIHLLWALDTTFIACWWKGNLTKSEGLPGQRGRQTAYMWHHQILLQKLIHWGSTKNTIENQQECWRRQASYTNMTSCTAETKSESSGLLWKNVLNTYCYCIDVWFMSSKSLLTDTILYTPQLKNRRAMLMYISQS